MLFPNFFLSLLTAKQSNPLISPLIFTCSIKLNLCVNLQCIICYRNSHTYNLSKYKSISVLVEERGYLTRKRPWSGYCLSHKAGMGSVAFFFFLQVWYGNNYDKPMKNLDLRVLWRQLVSGTVFGVVKSMQGKRRHKQETIFRHYQIYMRKHNIIYDSKLYLRLYLSN